MFISILVLILSTKSIYTFNELNLLNENTTKLLLTRTNTYITTNTLTVTHKLLISYI